jgi:hypothetical protein
MIRGGNAQFKFRLPYDCSDMEKVKIVFWQEDNAGPDPSRPLPIVKVLEQCSQSVMPNELIVTLNQEETLRFSDERKAYAQLRGSTYEGIPIVSREHMITVYPVYDDSILDEEILPTPSPDGWVYLDGQYIV